MIGSFERAKDLLLCAIMEQDPDTFGFTFMGQGAYRNVYRDVRSNFVYKVDKNILEGKRYSGYNYSEWIATYRSMSAFPYPLQDGRTARVAESQLFDFGRATILAQEYVPYASSREPIESRQDLYDLQTWFGVSDLHNDNYRLDYQHDVVITDLGFNSSQFGNDVWEVCSECGEGHYKKVTFPEEDSAAIKWADVVKAWRR